MDQRIVTLGGAVRRLRLQRGLSQSRLAREVGVDSTYVSHLERDTREPSISVLLRLAVALGVPAATLFAIAVWDQIPPQEREPYTVFVETLMESTEFLVSLDG